MINAVVKRMKATIDDAQAALDALSDALEEISADRKIRYKVRLALDELLTNVVSYAYEGREGEMEIRWEILDNPKAISVTIIDDGKPFNPLEAEEPEIDLSIEDRPIGGLGLFIVKNTMDDIFYCRENNQNKLTIKKLL